jgi:Protein of unknown function (DUF2950)
MFWIRRLEDWPSRYFINIATCVVVAMWALVSLRVAVAQQPGQKTFSSAEQASRALFVAVQKDDESGLLAILGPDAKQLTSSGDDIEDENNRIEFVQKYQQMHRLATEPDGTTTLYIGTENWPTPIPLVDKAGAWYFDTDAAKKEILLRRIRQNELATIQACHELVDAQKTYYSKPRDGDSVPQYAQRFVSDEGQHNGLYWLGADDEFDSPINPLVANAGSGRIAKELQVGPIPFHGYYFRILKRQGKNAPGGARDYAVDGKMARGFAFVAYPAQYGSSGVMTFVVNEGGIVYQKDLGTNTAELARAMDEYDPDSTWQRAG